MSHVMSSAHLRNRKLASDLNHHVNHNPLKRIEALKAANAQFTLFSSKRCFNRNGRNNNNEICFQQNGLHIPKSQKFYDDS